MRDDLTPTFAAPDLPPPGNNPGDCRYPAHTELTARLLRMMEERALFELARAEQRLARLEKICGANSSARFPEVGHDQGGHRIARKVTDWLNGVWRDDKNPPCGENLHCPDCGKHTMRITIGDRKGKPVVFCNCGAPSKRLINGIRKTTGIWLVPPPRRVPPREAVERMRRSPQYEGLSSRSKKLVDLLVEAVLDDGLVNGGIVMTATQLMAALGTRSGKQLYKAVNAAVAAKIVIRRSQASSNGQNGAIEPMGPDLSVRRLQGPIRAARQAIQQACQQACPQCVQRGEIGGRKERLWEGNRWHSTL